MKKYHLRSIRPIYIKVHLQAKLIVSKQNEIYTWRRQNFSELGADYHKGEAQTTKKGNLRA